MFTKVMIAVSKASLEARLSIVLLWLVIGVLQPPPANSQVDPGLGSAPIQTTSVGGRLSENVISAQSSWPSPRKARVHVADGSLTVVADDSSLAQILQQISQLTGMKITGEVADERVFGTYGPADMMVVLSGLVRGTGTNMVLVGRPGKSVRRLILTRREGDPSPPSLRSSGTFAPIPFYPPRYGKEGRPPELSADKEEPVQPRPAVPFTPSSTPQQGAVAPPAATLLRSPNGIKTPEEIQDQLRNLYRLFPPIRLPTMGEAREVEQLRQQF